MQDRRWTVLYPSQDGTGEGVMMQLPPVQRNVPAKPSPAQPSPGLLPNSSKAKRGTTGDIFQYDSSSSAAPLTKQYHCCWVKYGLWTCFILTLSVQTMLSRAQGTTTKLRFYSMNCESLHNVLVRFEAWAATSWRDYHQDIKM